MSPVSLSQIFSGYERAIAEGIGGLLTATLMAFLAASTAVPDNMKWMFALAATIPLIGLLAEMRVWSVLYTVGWFFGVVLLNSYGIIPLLEVVLFLGVPSAIWGVRGYIYFRDNGGF